MYPPVKTKEKKPTVHKQLKELEGSWATRKRKDKPARNRKGVNHHK